MASKIYITNNISELSDQDIADLNTIYNTAYYSRLGPDYIHKLIICILCLFCCLLNVIFYLLLTIRKKTSPFANCTTSLAVMSIIYAASYSGFIGIMHTKNNIYSSPHYPNTTVCLTEGDARLEVARTVLIHMSHTAGRWLVILNAVVKFNDVIYFCSGFNCPSTKAIVVSVMFTTIVLHIPHCFPRITTHTHTNLVECHEWTTLPTVVPLLDLFCEDVLPILGTLIFQVVIITGKIKIKTKSKQIIDNIGKRATRHQLMQLHVSQVDIKNKFLVNIAVGVNFLTTVPTAVRRIMILSNNYPEHNFFLEEAICDILDCTMLLNSTTSLIIYYRLLNKWVTAEINVSKSISHTYLTTVGPHRESAEIYKNLRRHTVSLGTLLIVEEKQNRRKSSQTPIPRDSRLTPGLENSATSEMESTPDLLKMVQTPAPETPAPEK